MLPLQRKVLFSAVTVAGFLLLVEVGARLAEAFLTSSSLPAASLAGKSIGTDWLDILDRDLPISSEADKLYVPDLELFWRLRPGTSLEVDNTVYETYSAPVRWNIRTNQDGYRGPPYPAAQDHATPVIVALGDSVTFGFRVREGETYPEQLQTFLRNRRFSRASTVNYGVPGYTSWQGRRQLDRILAQHRPDYVLLGFGANDIESDRLSDADKASRMSAWGSWSARFLNRLATGRLLLGRPAQRTDPDRMSRTVRVPPQDFRDNLRAMVRSAQQSGARVILLDLVFVTPLLSESIATIAQEFGVLRVDGRDVLERGLEDLLEGRRFHTERYEIERFWARDVRRFRPVYYDKIFYEDLFRDPVRSRLLQYLMVEPVHPNSLGHRLIAEAIGEGILADKR